MFGTICFDETICDQDFTRIQFFDKKKREIYQLYIHTLLVSLNSFYYKHLSAFLTKIIIEQNAAFVAMMNNF